MDRRTAYTETCLNISKTRTSSGISKDGFFGYRVNDFAIKLF